MEAINIDVFAKLWDTLLHGVDWIAYLIVTLGGLIGKYRLKAWSLDNALKTLIIGTICITIYALILGWSGTFVKADAPRLFFGYVVATGLYPITVKFIEKWAKKIFGNGFDGEQ
jgi:hypothetical protein